jgi:3-isopropylmalate dehydrogenase
LSPFIIRENTEGLYASRGGGALVGDKVATDALIITAAGSDSIIRFAFDYALANPPLSGAPTVTCVDKANVPRSYAFFRSRFDSIAPRFDGRVNVDRVYVDAFCAQMVLRPTSIHVAVAENMFGDIISDLAAGEPKRKDEDSEGMLKSITLLLELRHSAKAELRARNKSV